MSAALITQLLIALGPVALQLIPQLAALWQKQSLSLDEVNALCAPAKNSYDSYIAAAKAAVNPVPATP